ncbi:hypothetical protein CKA38_02275 [Ereboglobus luteus]|uniref:Ig-like domain-containing protein n=2 Tax=Ereboglobus luteus TaxID=1796921 RepID=A0A2U8E066_9BACT|nr:hypothetical protein CKA38_02275 [Ereboglobus luteus]
MHKGDSFTLVLPDGIHASGTVNVVTLRPDGTRYVGGKLDGWQRASVFFSLTDRIISGDVIIEDEQRAFVLDASINDSAGAVWREKRLDEVICHPFLPAIHATLQSSPDSEVAGLALRKTPVPAYESRPGAEVVVFLCFEGALIEGTQWNVVCTDGEPIVVAPSDYSNSDIVEIWRKVSEDYAPFNINVTTDPAVYARAASDHRVRCIFTSDSQWYDPSGQVGGVAILSVLGRDGDMYPCWVFTSSQSFAAESASHEIGHTFGLLHDGQKQKTANSSEGGEYYYGHGASPMSWGPIMGSSGRRHVIQWSKCEYADAVNRSGTGNTFLSPPQDDIDLIANYRLPRAPYTHIAPGFVDDNIGNTPANAVPLILSRDTSDPRQTGVIISETDANYHRFVLTGTRSVSLRANNNAITGEANLNIRLDLLDHNGSILATSGTGIATDSFTDHTLAAELLRLPMTSGTYFVKISGCGYKNPATDGFSAYGSIGHYTFWGAVDNIQPGAPVVTMRPSGTTLEYASGVLSPDPLSLTVTATGAAPLSYLWSKDSRFLSNTTRADGTVLAGVNTGTLVITNPMPSDAGSYSVIVTDANGLSVVSSATVALTKPDAPVITAQPFCRVTTTSGARSAAFLVIVASHAPVSYQWFKDGVPLTNTGRYSGVTTDTLIVADLTDADALVNYTVRVSNIGGHTISNIVNTTINNTVITIEPATPMIVEGGEITLKAHDSSGSADPQTPLVWQRRAPGATAWHSVTGNDSTGASLLLENVSLAQNGESYRIVVGNDNTPPVTLRVIPDFIPSPSGLGAMNTTISSTATIYSVSDSTLYIVSAEAHTVQSMKVFATNTLGLIDLKAGASGQAGFADGTGTNARFNAPLGADVRNWNCTIADTENHVIRLMKVSSGKITTIGGLAGSPGFADGTDTEARFNAPAGVVKATWADNYFYVADTENHAVRQIYLHITSRTPIVTTVAGLPGQSGFADGTGANARFDTPLAITMDRNGNIYVADSANSAVRKITPVGSGTTATYTVSTLGLDTPGGAPFVVPSGLYVDGSYYLYVADAGAHAIFRAPLANPRVFERVAGAEGGSGFLDGPALSARFNMPSGLTKDSHNALYIADHGNNALRVLTSSGTVFTISPTTEVPPLSVTPAKLTVGSQAVRASFDVSFPMAWRATIESGADWVYFSHNDMKFGSGSLGLSFHGRPEAGKTRTARIRVSQINGQGNPVTVTLEQTATSGTGGNTGGNGNNNGSPSNSSGGGGGGAHSLPALVVFLAIFLWRVRHMRLGPKKNGR